MEDGSPSALARSGYLELATMAAGHAAYHWDIGADVVSWSANAAGVLGLPLALISANSTYASLLSVSGGIDRFDTVHSGGMDDGAGVPFETEYHLRHGADGPEIAVEDTGRWFAGSDGSPSHVFGVVRRTDGRQHRDEQVRQLSSHDPQTNLLNRELIVEMLNAAVNRARNSSEPGAFLMMSVDNLQQINEIFGSDVGDSVIREVGQKTLKVMRAGDHLGRYAGNKLALVLRQCEAHEMRIATQRFLDTLRDTVITTDHGPTWATVSIGGTSITSDIENPRHALLSAEHALNQARRHASGQFFTDSFPDEWLGVHRRNMDEAEALLTAMKTGRLMIAFHPVRRVADDTIAMYDVTPHIAGGQDLAVMIPDVIAAAKRVGLIGLIDVNVIRSAVATLASSSDLCLCVPLSIETIEQPRTRAQIIDAVTENAACASQLVIDVASLDLASCSRDCLLALQQLQRLGARVSLNGFGMHAFPMQRISDHDGHFVRMDAMILHEARSSVLARRRLETAVEIARSFGSEILVTGIDPQRDEEVLRNYRIDLIRPTETDATSGRRGDEARPLRLDVRMLNAALAELSKKLFEKSGGATSLEPNASPKNIHLSAVETPETLEPRKS